MKYKDIHLYEAIKSYLDDFLPKMKKYSSHTIKSYSKTIALFLDFLNDKRNIKYINIACNDFNDQNIVLFLEYLLHDRQNTDRTINNRLAGIISFCKYLKRKKMITDIQLASICEISKKKVVSKIPEELTIEQIKQILSFPDQSNHFELRALTYMILLYDTGCRNSELLNLKLKDIKFDEKYNTICVIGKGEKFRLIPVSVEAISILKKYINIFQINDDESYIFYTKRNNIKTRMSEDNAARILPKYEKKIKDSGITIPHLHPHLFRHARAQHLYRAGMPLPLISEWLGHSNIETSLIYAYANLDMKKKALEIYSNKIITTENNETFKYDEKDILKKFCGL